MNGVEIVGQKLLIRDIEVADHEVVDYVSQSAPEARQERVRLALRLGVTALRTLGTTERVDYVERRFGSLQAALESMLDGYFGEKGRFGEFFGDKGRLASTLESYFGQRGRLDEYFGDQGRLQRALDHLFGPQGEFPRLLEEHFGDDGALLRRLYNPTEKKGPIYQIQQEILDALRDLGRDLGMKRAEEALKPSAKGERFEEICATGLAAIAKVYGDVVTDTRDVDGAVPNSKKGDYLIDVQGNSACRFVLEAEDRATLTLPYVKEYMKEALENRLCAYGIFAARHVESLPRFVGWINEYDLDGGRRFLVCATATQQLESRELQGEMLRIAYGWARMRTQLETVSAEGIDASVIRGKLSVAKDALKNLGGITRQCTTVIEAAQEIEKLSQAVRSTLFEQFDAIDTELLKATRLPEKQA